MPKNRAASRKKQTAKKSKTLPFKPHAGRRRPSPEEDESDDYGEQVDARDAYLIRYTKEHPREIYEDRAVDLSYYYAQSDHDYAPDAWRFYKHPLLGARTEADVEARALRDAGAASLWRRAIERLKVQYGKEMHGEAGEEAYEKSGLSWDAADRVHNAVLEMLETARREQAGAVSSVEGGAAHGASANQAAEKEDSSSGSGGGNESRGRESAADAAPPVPRPSFIPSAPKRLKRKKPSSERAGADVDVGAATSAVQDTMERLGFGGAAATAGPSTDPSNGEFSRSASFCNVLLLPGAHFRDFVNEEKQALKMAAMPPSQQAGSTGPSAVRLSRRLGQLAKPPCHGAKQWRPLPPLCPPSQKSWTN